MLFVRGHLVGAGAAIAVGFVNSRTQRRIAKYATEKEWRLRLIDPILALADNRARLMEDCMTALRHGSDDEVADLERRVYDTESLDLHFAHWAVENPELLQAIANFDGADSQCRNALAGLHIDRSGPKKGTRTEQMTEDFENANSRLRHAIRELYRSAGKYIIGD